MRLDLDVILPSLIAAGLILVISFPVHECAHAWAAYRLGDGTAKLFGRLTLNPIVHFDPLGGFLLLVSSLLGFGIGWAKPTPVNPINLRGGRRSEGLVAAAGPLSNLLLYLWLLKVLSQLLRNSLCSLERNEAFNPLLLQNRIIDAN